MICKYSSSYFYKLLKHQVKPYCALVNKIFFKVNSSNGNGILTGRWDNEFADGVNPLCWTGSIAILQQYMATKQPVSSKSHITFWVEKLGQTTAQPKHMLLHSMYMTQK